MKKKKEEKIELTQKDKESLVSYMMDPDQVFDAFSELKLSDRLADDADGEKEEVYYELVKEFVKDCEKKLKGQINDEE